MKKKQTEKHADNSFLEFFKQCLTNFEKYHPLLSHTKLAKELDKKDSVKYVMKWMCGSGY